MLPDTINQNSKNNKIESFTDILTRDYYFDVNQEVENLGTRSLWFDKREKTLLISHVFSNRVHLLNLHTGKLRWFDHHGSTVRSVQTAGIHNEIITASWDGTCAVTDFDTLKRRLLLTERDMGRAPHITLSANKKFAYSYSYDSDRNPERISNTVRKWSMTDGSLEQKIILPGKHIFWRRCGSVEEFENNLFVISDSGYLHVFDVQSGKLIAESFFNDLLQSLTIIPEHSLIAFGGDSGTIYFCSYTGKLKTKIKAHRFHVSHIHIHPENQDIIMSTSHDGTLRIWNIAEINKHGLSGVKLICVRGNRNDSLWTMTQYNDFVFTGGDSGVMEIFSIKTKKAEFIGRLWVFEKSFVYLSADKKSFYASDLSLIRVFKMDGTPLDDSFAGYLKSVSSNLNGFRDLFAGSDKTRFNNADYSFGYLQLTN